MSELFIGLNREESIGTTACINGDLNRSVHRDAAISMTTRNLPRPGEENAPTFDPERPEKLGRFFERIEDWFLDKSIEEDVEKKRRIVKYLDADSEIQWKALSKFETGSFNEFKAQVMSSYPKAEEVLIGSMSALKKKILKLELIAPGDQDELSSLIRIMNAEVLKLTQISPPIHTNRELVELFLSRLVPDFAISVSTKLSVKSLLNDSRKQASRDPEDLYDIVDVMEMAKHTSLEYASPLGKFLWTVPDSIPETSKLEKTIAHLTESIGLQAQYNIQMNERLTSLENFDQSKPVSINEFDMLEDIEMERESVSYVNIIASTRKCYYCGIYGHIVPECQDALRHLKLGWIQRIDNQLRLSDGSRIPRYADMTTKSIIENINGERLENRLK